MIIQSANRHSCPIGRSVSAQILGIFALACCLLAAIPCRSQTPSHTATKTVHTTEELQPVSEAKIRELLQTFNVDIETRDFASLAKLAIPDVTVMWYGEKYSNWQEFSDQVLTPLTDKPSPTNTWQIDKLVVTPEMAWGYTTTTRHLSGDQGDAVVWMTFVLERYNSAGKPSASTGDWKITYIESMLKRRANAAQKVGTQDQKKVESRPK